MKFESYGWIFEELKFLITLGLSPSVACLTEGIQIKVSNVFIGRASGENISSMLSALFIGQIITGCVSYSISEGLSACVNTFCSQAYGEKQHKSVGLYYYRVLLLMILICFPIFSLFISVEHIVYFFTQDRSLSHGAGIYTSIYCYGFPAYAYYYISVRFLLSNNIVWYPLAYLVIGCICSGALQYILILHYNFGIAGAAAGSVVGIYIVALLVFTHIRFARIRKSTAVEFSTELVNEWFEILKYAIPGIVQSLIQMTAVSIFPIIILLLVCRSKEQLAIYSIMYSVWYVISLFTMGFKSSIAVRVGHLLGENDIQKAKRSAIFGIALGEAGFVLLCIGLMALSGPLSQLFTTDANFAKELYFNLLIMPILSLTDIILLGQGVSNACGMQYLQAISKFIILFLLGFLLEYFLVDFVQWKALFLFTIQAVGNILCFAICMSIIFTRNWETFVLKLSKNKQISTDFSYIQDNPDVEVKYNCFCSRIFSTPRSYLLFRYIFCLCVSCSIFILFYHMNRYSVY